MWLYVLLSAFFCLANNYFKAIEIGNLSQVAPVDTWFSWESICLSKTALGALFIIAGTLVIVWK